MTATTATQTRRIITFLILATSLVAPTSALAARPPTNAGGASVAITVSEVAPSDEISFSGSGFRNADGTGQLVTVKLDDDAILGTFAASSTGVLNGSVRIPERVTAGTHWLRYLAGAGRVGDDTARSLVTDFSVVRDTGTTSPPTQGPEPGTGPDPGSPTIVARSPELVASALQRSATGDVRASFQCTATTGFCIGIVEVRSRNFARISGTYRRAIVARSRVRVAAGRTVKVRLRGTAAGIVLGRRSTWLDATVHVRSAGITTRSLATIDGVPMRRGAR